MSSSVTAGVAANSAKPSAATAQRTDPPNRPALIYFRFRYACTFVAADPTEPTAEKSYLFVQPNFSAQ